MDLCDRYFISCTAGVKAASILLAIRLLFIPLSSLENHLFCYVKLDLVTGVSCSTTRDEIGEEGIAK